MFSLYKTVELMPERAKAAEQDSIFSVCTGATGNVTLIDSAVIILYATMLSASDMFSLIITSLLPLFNGIQIIPMALLVAKFGNQQLILRVCSLAFCAYLMVVAAPFFEIAAIPVLILSLVAFAIF